MSLSSILLGIVVLVFACVLVIWIILKYTRPSTVIKLSPSTGTISQPKAVGNVSDIRESFFTPPGSTIMVSLYCGLRSNTQTIFNHDGYSILRFGYTVGLIITPGTQRSPPKTILAIKTQGTDLNSPYEYIDVQNFPLQKWVHVAIVREGRRFTVYYNGKVVGSNRTQYFPAIESSQFIIGSEGLVGEFVNPKLIPFPLRQHEIENELHSSSDTRNVPYKPMDFDIFNIFTCPDGLFCFSTSEPINDPLRVWKTPYA
jgi:hypothetical protein